ncbi:hypothetical protein [Pseudomonas sp. AN-1]|uniref:hypothetical protein n=1 Tax=Pseudomonas sp. AN-1 TaxID=3096605 RepID=UPI002A699B21|nr:hypothetical protein [Pseudomonas sp. AN-1]WPP45347.1 hypothetical protein SK095_19220 [Pseudomonas sp. AN-1]
MALFLGVALAFSFAFMHTAWVSEDAFITFRVVDNALNGYGIVWNPGERVQVYTHPLWFFLVLSGVAIFDDPYYFSLGLSYVLLIATLLLLGRVAKERWALGGIVLVCALLWSRAFVDYSSSGLENPLVHALLVLYALVCLRGAGSGWGPLLLTLLASALFLTRPDVLVLIFPSFVYVCWRERQNLFRLILGLAVGGIPALLWVAFSVFYYGVPVPNTALAKVATGIDSWQSAVQAWNYLVWTAETDLVTLALLLLGVVLGCSSRDRVLASLGLGIVAWFLYLFYVGADYMGGRFFSAAVLLAVVVCAVFVSRNASFSLVAAVLVFLVFNAGALSRTVFSPLGFSQQLISSSGIADERGFYYQALGLWPSLQRGTWFAHPWLAEGAAIGSRPGLYARCAIGMSAFAAGPAVRWIDPLALTEPFLARLPARTNVRVGHYERAFPKGFLESETSRVNKVEDPVLRDLYRDVDIAVRAPLLSEGRLAAIWRLNSGAYSGRLGGFDREAIGLPGVPVQTRAPLSCFGLPYGWDGFWRIDGDPARVSKVMVQDGLSQQ